MITFLGDVALLNDSLSSNYKIDGDFIVNFEYVYNNNNNLTPTKGKINLSSPYCNLEIVFGKNPVAAGVANNHIFDYGKQGFDSTIEAIQRQNIFPLGLQPYWYDKRTCILSYTMFNGIWDKENIVQFEKSKVKKDIDVSISKGAQSVIVFIHWGIENNPLYTKDQQDIGHWLIDNKVSLVVGNHPHCIQPVERYKNKYIFYSIGNCIFPPLNVPSHYDDNGIAQRRYRFNWRSWNNCGLAVVYDEELNTVIRVDKIRFKRGLLSCIEKNMSISELISLGLKNRKWSKYSFAFRKYWLFLASNSFVDGKLFDLNSLKQELHK